MSGCHNGEQFSVFVVDVANYSTIISFSEVSILATRCINIRGPSPRHGTAPGGYKLVGPRGARRPLARTHALGPGTGKHRVRPASVRGPWSCHPLENPQQKLCSISLITSSSTNAMAAYSQVFVSIWFNF